jgi:hypothetical protein
VILALSWQASSTAGIQLGCPGWRPGRGGVSALHLVAEELFEEFAVGELMTAGQGQAPRQRCDELAQFEPAHEDLSSGETEGVGALIDRPLWGWRLEGVAGKTTLDHDRLRTGVRLGVFSGPLAHARDEVHIERLGVEGPATSQRRGCADPPWC